MTNFFLLGMQHCILRVVKKTFFANNKIIIIITLNTADDKLAVTIWIKRVKTDGSGRGHD